MPFNGSRLSRVLRSRGQTLSSGLGGGFLNCAEHFVGQGSFLFVDSKLSCLSTLSRVNSFLKPTTVLASTSDFHVVNQRRNLSLIGAVSRTFCTPSVSGPSYQVCEYHIERLLPGANQFSICRSLHIIPMAACGSKVVMGGSCLHNLFSRNADPSRSQVILSYGCKNFDGFRKVTMSLRSKEPSNNDLIYGYFLYESVKASYRSNPFAGSKGLRCFSSECSSADAAADVFFDGSGRDEQIASSSVSSDQKTMSDRSLRMLSGSCYLPHPDKEDTGGEDAHFICVDEQAIGVADGVGGWAEMGVNAGLYAQELMSNAVCAIAEEPKGSIDPKRVLEKAHLITKAKGSSTACIIALTDQGVHAINLGDSGFVVIRDGRTIFQSPVQQHGFNFTYQLECGIHGDLPSSGQVFNVPVATGDVIVAGTDGLFDNLYNNEVTAVVVEGVRANLEPQVTAQKIAALARQRALDRNRQTPFSTAAQDAGFRYFGGKLDDITVVVSYITKSNDP
ncbi:hypothetical protein Sjap_010422 [Stephania japonica]|uniref:Protein phosphatase n=1 Tax=Stephania japonica TaxID=461633 RepID=A0AAP0JAD3_9MAGN